MEDTAVFEIDMEDLHALTDDSDSNFAIGPASLPCLPDGLSHSLKFKTHLFEVIEELRLRRVTDHDNENRFKQLIREKQDLEKQYDEALSKVRLAEEVHKNQLSEVSRTLDTKLKELVDQQARQTVILETADCEAKILKEDIRKLQLSKYSLEKQVRELELKLQLQTTVVGTGFEQVAELESMCAAACKDVSRLRDYVDKLGTGVQDAADTNKKLSDICQHQQQCVINEQSNRIVQLQRDLADTKVALASCHADRADRLMNINVELQSMQLELKSSKEEIVSLEQQINIRNTEMQKSTQVLRESHKIIKQHIDAAEMCKGESKQLSSQLFDMESRFTALQQQYKDTLDKYNTNQETLNITIVRHGSELDGYKEKLAAASDQYQELFRSYSDLEELNSQWSQKNLILLEQMGELRSLFVKDTVDVFVATEFNLLDKEVQTVNTECVTPDVGLLVRPSLCDVSVQTSLTTVQETESTVDCSMTSNIDNFESKITLETLPTLEHQSVLMSARSKQSPVTAGKVSETHKQCSSSFNLTDVISGPSGSITGRLSEKQEESSSSCSLVEELPGTQAHCDSSNRVSRTVDETEIHLNSSCSVKTNDRTQLHDQIQMYENRVQPISSVCLENALTNVRQIYEVIHEVSYLQNSSKVGNDSDSDIKSLNLNDSPTALHDFIDAENKAVKERESMLHSKSSTESVSVIGPQPMARIEQLVGPVGCQRQTTAVPDRSTSLLRSGLLCGFGLTDNLTEPARNSSDDVTVKQLAMMITDSVLTTVVCRPLMFTTTISTDQSNSATNVTPVVSLSDSMTRAAKLIEHSGVLTGRSDVLPEHEHVVNLLSSTSNWRPPMLKTKSVGVDTSLPLTAAMSEHRSGESLQHQMVTQLSTSGINRKVSTTNSRGMDCVWSEDDSVGSSQALNSGNVPITFATACSKFPSVKPVNVNVDCVKKPNWNFLKLADCSYRESEVSNEVETMSSCHVRLPPHVSTGQELHPSFKVSSTAQRIPIIAVTTAESSTVNELSSDVKTDGLSDSLKNIASSIPVSVVTRATHDAHSSGGAVTAVGQELGDIPNDIMSFQCKTLRASSLSRSASTSQYNQTNFFSNSMIFSESLLTHPTIDVQFPISDTHSLSMPKSSRSSFALPSRAATASHSSHYFQNNLLPLRTHHSEDALNYPPQISSDFCVSTNSSSVCANISSKDCTARLNSDLHSISSDVNIENKQTSTAEPLPSYSSCKPLLGFSEHSNSKQFSVDCLLQNNSKSVNNEEKMSSGRSFEVPLVCKVSVSLNREDDFNREKTVQVFSGSDLSASRPRVKRSLFTCRGPLMIESTESHSISPRACSSSEKARVLPSMLREPAEPALKKMKKMVFTGPTLQFTTDQTNKDLQLSGPSSQWKAVLMNDSDMQELHEN